jgi:hypothetical protein
MSSWRLNPPLSTPMHETSDGFYSAPVRQT